MILIDMSAIKAGGGCQLALNFISEISNGDSIIGKELVFLVPDIGPLSQNLNKRFPRLIFVTSPSSNFVKRVIFEYKSLKYIYKKYSIDKIYTFFGAGLPHPKEIKSIVSVAYPIICYDESPYWRYISSQIKRRQKFINWLRLKRLRHANLIVAETHIMKKRLQKVLGCSNENIVVYPPSPSEFIANTERKYELTNKTIKFLLLSGSSNHKNLWRLPELVSFLNSKNNSIKFVLSVDKISYINSLREININIDLVELFKKHEDSFDFRGNIPPDKIDDIYMESDFLLSLSDLESFSNNYMEAWKSSLPLIVSDRDFAREICKDSAIYIEPHNPDSAAKLINDHIMNISLINRNLINGKRYLKDLPDNKGRVNQILKLISG